MHHRAIVDKQSQGQLTKTFGSKLEDLDNFIWPAQTTSDLKQKLQAIIIDWACNISK